MLFVSVVHCGFPPQIQNGFVKDIRGNSTYNGTATYQCYSGFNIVGPSNVTCGADGKWSRTPACEGVYLKQFYNIFIYALFVSLTSIIFVYISIKITGTCF